MPNENRAMLLENSKRTGVAYTFDDLTLQPGLSEVAPEEVSLRTKITRTIEINNPQISAAMDTVTEFQMAVAMGKLGGIGVLHRYMSIEDQTWHVRRIIFEQACRINSPVTMSAATTVGEFRDWQRKRSSIGRNVIDTCPIHAEDDESNIIGCIDTDCMRFRNDPSVRLGSIMIPIDQVLQGPPHLEPPEAYKQLLDLRKLYMLLFDGKKLVGMYLAHDLERRERDNDSGYSVDSNSQLLAFAAIGVGDDAEERAKALIDNGVSCIVIDFANGHSRIVAQALERVKRLSNTIQVIAGNICTGAGAQFLIDSGADAVKIGVGPGSICTTRIMTGIGIPQLTAVMEAYEVAEPHGVPVIADGGMVYPGDAAKALAAGARVVMSGHFYAGTAEVPLIGKNENGFSVYRGMGSPEALRNPLNDRYSSHNRPVTSTPQGVAGKVPYKGPVENQVQLVAGGIRACMSSVGARTIEQLHNLSRFRVNTGSGQREGRPHDIILGSEGRTFE